MTLQLCPKVTVDRNHFGGWKCSRYKQVKINVPVPDSLLRRKVKNNLRKSH